MLPRNYRSISLALLGGIIIISAVVYFFINKSAYDNHQSISNLSEYTDGKPTDKKTLDYIEYDLYRVLNYNSDKAKENDSVKDIVVRKGSFKQTSKNSINDVSFIVDIASLKQSYSVKYQWRDDKKRSEGLDEWGTLVECLPIDKLIYGDFQCVDDRIKERGVDNSDPIGRILPHTVKYKYTIKDYAVNDDFGDVDPSNRPDETVTLNVEAFVPSWEDEASVLAQYDSEIKDWIRTNKLNPDRYALNYIY